jgi:hypothetical protein
MSHRRVQMVILCEDRQQEVFARHFLEKRGFTGRVRIEICPPGSQSGEQYVRNKYPLEVKAYRQKRNNVSIGLVILIDADNYTVKERLKQLDDILGEQSLPLRKIDEEISVFVPKRNIETWIHYLKGEFVEEDREKPYTKFAKAGDCKPYAEVLAKQCWAQNLPQTAPPSLQAACGEIQRLLRLLPQ